MGGHDETGTKIRLALETASVEFIDENGGGPGVRLAKAATEKTLEFRGFREPTDGSAGQGPFLVAGDGSAAFQFRFGTASISSARALRKATAPVASPL